ncbi:MAG: hypothetical protein JXQ67_01675 [Campylobacterales bacterium]|nr:hypothetical protein [Campylobacterales bacterium]
MKLKLAAIFLAFTLLFSSNATASFFTTPETITLEMIELVSKLSDDIGIMADRILDMAGEIGKMADKIGVMADRIVHTEEMMAQLTLDMATLSTNVSQNTQDIPTLILSNTGTDTLNSGDVPLFTSNITTNEMLIYVSSSITMDTNTVSVLVTSNETLQSKWEDLQALAKDGKIYIAAKSIDGNTISSLSNILTYTTLY